MQEESIYRGRQLRFCNSFQEAKLPAGEELQSCLNRESDCEPYVPSSIEENNAMSQQDQGGTPLFEACQAGDLNHIERLLRAGADIASVNDVSILMTISVRVRDHTACLDTYISIQCHHDFVERLCPDKIYVNFSLDFLQPEDLITRFGHNKSANFLHYADGLHLHRIVKLASWLPESVQVCLRGGLRSG